MWRCCSALFWTSIILVWKDQKVMARKWRFLLSVNVVLWFSVSCFIWIFCIFTSCSCLPTFFVVLLSRCQFCPWLFSPVSPHPLGKTSPCRWLILLGCLWVTMVVASHLPRLFRHRCIFVQAGRFEFCFSSFFPPIIILFICLCYLPSRTPIVEFSLLFKINTFLFRTPKVQFKDFSRLTAKRRPDNTPLWCGCFSHSTCINTSG